MPWMWPACSHTHRYVSWVSRPMEAGICPLRLVSLISLQPVHCNQPQKNDPCRRYYSTHKPACVMPAWLKPCLAMSSAQHPVCAAYHQPYKVHNIPCMWPACSHTHNLDRWVRLPMEAGISPLSLLLDSVLQPVHGHQGYASITTPRADHPWPHSIAIIPVPYGHDSPQCMPYVAYTPAAGIRLAWQTRIVAQPWQQC